jgi:hypothetical protein
MELQMELNRLEEARGYNPRLSPMTMESPTNSAASSFKRGRGRPRKDEASVKKRKVTKANAPPAQEPQPVAKKREARVAKQASLTTPDTVTRSRPPSRSSSVVSERTARKLQRSATKPKPKKAATTTPTTRPVRGKKNRPKKSSEKDVGDRCYARWLNKQYYWGKITEIVAKDNQIFYTASTLSYMYACSF